MDAWILVGAAGVDLFCVALALKSQGWLYALVGAMVILSMQGYLAAGQAVSIGNVGGGCNPCGYSLTAADTQLVTIIISILDITSWLVVIDLVWPGRQTNRSM